MGLLCIGPPSWASLHVNSPPRSGFCGSVQSPDLKIALAQWGKWDLVRHDLLQAQDRHCEAERNEGSTMAYDEGHFHLLTPGVEFFGISREVIACNAHFLYISGVT